jgi:ribose 5-phosphate isomerase A
MTSQDAKKKVGYAAADLIQSEMTVGIGTGSTVFYFIERLGKRCQGGLKINAVCSSVQSEMLAKKEHIPVIGIDEVGLIDITVDGADEIDSLKRMIKGGGGALVREKILASSSREMVVVVDESKLVSQLGKCKLPVEIIPFGYIPTIEKIKKAGYRGILREKSDGSLLITDNGNFIFDIHFDHLREHPEQDEERLLPIPGVVDTGFFFNLAGRVIIGYLDGRTVIKS